MVKVLLVDDSAVARNILSSELSKHPEISIVGLAPDPYIARNKIIKRKPDVVVLDMEMPRMDGLTFLKRLMRYHPIPVIAVSSSVEAGGETAMRALEAGAVDVIGKPVDAGSVGDIALQLADKIIAAAHAVQVSAEAVEEESTAEDFRKIGETKRIVAIGASTGGTKAIAEVLTRLPKNAPGAVIVLHMPEKFTAHYAARLNAACEMEVREAVDGDRVRQGLALVAPGGLHMVLRGDNEGFYVKVKGGPLVFHQRPSVEVLFSSVARYAGPKAIGVILTGMGADGAGGLMKMRVSGADTIAQHKDTCVVYGMPRAAIELGAARYVVSLNNIPGKILSLVHRNGSNELKTVALPASAGVALEEGDAV